jgi:putative nucleotidyltransferase with HDIG domain
MSGLQLLAAAREVDSSIGFILLTDQRGLRNGIEALRLGADDYILKPYEVDEMRHAVFRTLHHRKLMRKNREQMAHVEDRLAAPSQQMEGMLIDALMAIASAVEIRDGYTGQHVERVTRYAVATARRMGLDSDAVRHLWIGAMLHDIGKIRIPDEILRKPTRLSTEEEQIIKRHPLISANILEQSDFLRPAVPAILHQHERWDGGGYPNGLAGDAISIAGRILGVAEAFDALVTPRPYRSKRSKSEAVMELRRCAGAQFDATVVDAFVTSFSESRVGDSGDMRNQPPSRDMDESIANT